MLFLIQDGITNGAIYALLGLALVLVFAVTRVILIPQGEFVTYGALTYASLSAGQMPGTARLAVAMGAVAFLLDLMAARRSLGFRLVARAFAVNVVLPAIVLALAMWSAAHHAGVAVNIALSLLIVAAIGVFLYRIAFQPLAHASVLVLLIASVGCHLALQGFGLVFFGAEGQRGPTMADAAFTVGPLRFTGQSIAVYGITVAFIAALWLFFGLTIYGKALRATAVNRLGARLVGIRTTLSGQIAFLLASVIGAISGILIVPITTLYYDTGFLIGLKGFIAAIIGGLVSYPLTAVAALVAMGLVLLTGVGGLTSFGQAAFCGFGAYTTAVLTTAYGVSPWLTLPLSLLVSGIAAVALGLVTVRLSGHYLPLGTIAW